MGARGSLRIEWDISSEFMHRVQGAVYGSIRHGQQASTPVYEVLDTYTYVTKLITGEVGTASIVIKPLQGFDIRMHGGHD